jgi:hypothetical protein
MRDTLLAEMLILSRWDQLDPSAQEEAASAVAARLPEPFRFDGLETHELGQQRHRVAFYTWNEARFALIPGGPATLGYDTGKPFIPTQNDMDSWEEDCREFALNYPNLESYVERILTPLRQVTFKPFLLETTATNLTPWVLDPVRGGYHMTWVSYPQTQERIAQEGFRFPSLDEWEYACAAGARTLWRWGDECPIVRLRTKETHLQWDLHLRPNAFGLLIAANPYNIELTNEMGVWRGGDGGTALHAGAGRLFGWLTLASSYWGVRQRVPKPDVHTAFLRRAYSIFQ